MRLLFIKIIVIIDLTMKEAPLLPSFQAHQRAFSLVELLIVIAIIGIVAAIAIPTMAPLNRRTKVTATAADFRTFGDAFRAFSYLEGGWPPDSHETVPPGVGMEAYLSKGAFERESPIGGRYNWEGPSHYDYAGISLTTTPASVEEMEQLDDILDDGVLTTGFFRLMPNGRYTYVLEYD